jgi:predicted AAA+ superfamily ATPase
MEKNKLKQIIIDQNSKKQEKELIKREIEVEINKQKKSKQILIISGIRRAGKSTLLNMIRASNQEKDYYFNFDDDRITGFKIEDFQLLYEIFLELYGQQEVFYFDEIQNIPGWERFARRLHDDEKKVYITGSNASMLSRELGTRLTGRHIEKKLFPFSFREFLLYKNIDIPSSDKLTTEESAVLKRAFNRYLKTGGFPEYLKYKNEDYLKSLYENIIYRDIIARYNLNSEKQIKELVYYIASNVGKEASFNSLKNVIGVKNATTVKDYFEYLQNSYLAFLLPRHDYSLKKQIYYNKKIYLIDNALARAVGFRFSEDRGQMLENIVFLELKRRNKEIYFYQEKGECDFVVKDGIKIREVLQVTESLADEKCRQRELRGLLEAMEAYKLENGTVLVEDDEGEEFVKNRKINVLPIWKWLIFH